MNARSQSLCVFVFIIWKAGTLHTLQTAANSFGSRDAMCSNNGKSRTRREGEREKSLHNCIGTSCRTNSSTCKTVNEIINHTNRCTRIFPILPLSLCDAFALSPVALPSLVDLFSFCSRRCGLRWVAHTVRARQIVAKQCESRGHSSS